MMIYAELIEWKTIRNRDKKLYDNIMREMLYARCLSKGANRIGADLLLGLYTAEEMADTFLNEKQVNRNEDGTIAEVIEIKETIDKK